MERYKTIWPGLLALLCALSLPLGTVHAATLTYTGNAFYADGACPEVVPGSATDWNDGRNWGTVCGGGPIPGINDTVIMGLDSHGVKSQIAPPNTTVANLTLKDDADLIGRGNLTVTDTLNWTESGNAGLIESNITIPPGGLFTIVGDAPRTFAGSTLTNRGTVVWSGGQLMITARLNSAGTDYEPTQIFNFGTFRMTVKGGTSAGANMVVTGNGTAERVFSNSGILEANPGTGQTIYIQRLKFSNNNVVDVKSGGLDIDSQGLTGNHSGTFQTAAGTVFSMHNDSAGVQGLQTFADTVRFVGAGQSILANTALAGTLTAGTAAGTAGKLLLTLGLHAPTSLKLKTFNTSLIEIGTRDVGGGGTSVTGGTWTITPNSNVHFNSTSAVQFVATQLDNQGILTIKGNGLTLGDNTTCVNNGTMNWTQGDIIAQGTANFSNLGTFNANSAATFIGQFRNGGIVNLGTATTARKFNLSGSFTQTSAGRINFKIGGTAAGSQFDQLVVNGGDLTLAGAVGVTALNNYVPPAGSNFLLIDRTASDPTVGTFSGLPQGGTLIAGSQGFIADYTKGFALHNIPLLSISGPSAAITEGNSSAVNATFTITLSKFSTQQITVNYTTLNSTALAGADYTKTSGTLSFAAGQTSKTVMVPILGDTADEADETFKLQLSAPSNAALGASFSATATITDDDATPTVVVSDALSTYEGSSSAPGTATFNILLSQPSGRTVTVNYLTVDNTAKAGEDYSVKSGSVTFVPDATTGVTPTRKSIVVTYIGDSKPELNEPFFLDIKTPINATVADGRGVVYIRNDDGPQIFIDDAPAVFEGNSGTVEQSFTVRLSAASTDIVTVDWTTANNTAVAGSDYTAASGRLSFLPGAPLSQTIKVLVKGDTVVEPTETYRVKLSRPVYATLGDSSAVAYIRNDDKAPTASPSE